MKPKVGSHVSVDHVEADAVADSATAVPEGREAPPMGVDGHPIPEERMRLHVDDVVQVST
jgi:hypothetical protein